MVSWTSFIFSMTQALCILYYFANAQFGDLGNVIFGTKQSTVTNCAKKCKDDNYIEAEKFAQICKWKDYAQCLKDTCSELEGSKLPEQLIQVAQRLCGNKTDFFLTHLCRVRVRKNNPSCAPTTANYWDDYCSNERFSLTCLTPIFLQKCNQTGVDIETHYRAYLAIEHGIEAIFNDPSQKKPNPSEDCEYLINPENSPMGGPNAMIDNSSPAYENETSSDPPEIDDDTTSGAGFITITPYIMASYLSALYFLF